MMQRLVFVAASLLGAALAAEPDRFVPASAPRTWVRAGQEELFRSYCTTGDGAKAFARIKADLDRDYLQAALPAEPVTYGDPSPSKRTSEKADAWRAQQDTTGRLSAVAEAAALCWLVTGEERYFAKARDILLGVARWQLGPPGRAVDWQAGPVPGATDVYYNDEAHFRLWRKLPQVYDQIRAKLSPEDRAVILAHFKARGTRSAEWIEQHGAISKVRRNSIESELSSHPVRFMPMTGLAGLALWEDLPEARGWWASAYRFYGDQFTPWGGDDGGWGEGSAYWRGTFEHATFQDTLLALADPLAYSTPFWKNSPYFCLYNVQPYLHTIFGDASNAGRFNLEPAIADYFEHMARVHQNGFFRGYAALCTDTRPRPIDKGLAGVDRGYPAAAEFLLRNFIVADRPLPPARALSELPPHRFFRDVGWVSLHSALGRPDDDIQLTFRASPYGSFSHSHADQLGFILNAFGEGLAINSAYREYHNSPHHEQWTRQSISKNVILIDGIGQLAKSKQATAKITRFEQTPRAVWTTGDATAAYRAAQKKPATVRRVTRDVVFVDQRYVVLRDRIELATPGKISWLLHAEKHLAFDRERASATILGAGRKAQLSVQLLVHVARADRPLDTYPALPAARQRIDGANPARENAARQRRNLESETTSQGFPADWRATVTNEFPVPVDPKYAAAAGGSPYVTGTWHNQAHLRLDSAAAAQEFTIYAVLWPDRAGRPITGDAALEGDLLTVRRPDGKTDVMTISDEALTLK